LSYQEVFLRLGAAVAVGALIGLDRELRRKPAGLRTMALVALGSAVFVLTGIESAEGVSHDAASRVIQGIVTGIGFLGAGTILRGAADESVKGLTTAASTWLAAAAGVACGLAHWPLVIGSCVLGLIILAIIPVEKVLQNRRKTDAKVPE
jgi:putative Mg2+ transporter-C (MgtC) family protein